MDVGRLDDISKNMGVQVKHRHPQNPAQQNMDVHGLNTCKTWASKNMKIWTPMLFETKVWTIEHHVDRSNVWTIGSLFNQIYFSPTWIENNDVSTLFVTSTSPSPDAVTALPVEFSSKWICRTCKSCLILMIYNGHLRRRRCYKMMMKGKTD